MKNIIDSDMERMRERSEDPIPTEMTAEELDAHEIAYYAVRGTDRDPVAAVAEVEKMINQHTLSIIEKVVGETYTGHTSDDVSKAKQDVAYSILSGVKQMVGE